MKRIFYLCCVMLALCECRNAKKTTASVECYRQRWTQEYLATSSFESIISQTDGRKYVRRDEKVYWSKEDGPQNLSIDFLKKIMKENFRRIALMEAGSDISSTDYVALKMAASNGGMSYETVYGLNHFNISPELFRLCGVEDMCAVNVQLHKSPEGNEFYVFPTETEAKTAVLHIISEIAGETYYEKEQVLVNAYKNIGIENFEKRLMNYRKIAQQVSTDPQLEKSERVVSSTKKMKLRAKTFKRKAREFKSVPVYTTSTEVHESEIESEQDLKSTYAPQAWARKYFEAYMPKVYVEPNGEKNVGYGHSIRYGAADESEALEDDIVDLKEASELMKKDFTHELQKVKRMLPNHAPWEVNAAAELFFNCNQTNLLKSKLWKKIKNHEDPTNDWLGYCYFSRKGVKTISKGLQERRRFELYLYKGNFEKVWELGQVYRSHHMKRDGATAIAYGLEKEF